jgi:PAS domain S-box-containing protein
VQTKKHVITSIRNLRYLPSYASYVLEQQLAEFVRFQIKLSRDIEVPLLKLLDKLTEEQLVQLATQGATELLNCLKENNAENFIKESTERWRTNQLPQVNMYDVMAEDITLITYVRKQALLHFINGYCSSMEQAIELVKEIDLFCLRSETEATNTYIDLLKNRIDEHSHFIEKINNTSPGIIYVFDLLDQREIYSNNKVGTLLGYDNEELHQMGTNVLSKLMHPEDQVAAQEYLESLRNAKDGEILSFRYRLKDKFGEYRWMRCYETIFRRNTKGTAKEIIGIALDVDREKRTADELKKQEAQLKESLQEQSRITEELKRNEERYKKAEALTHLGSYTWDLKANKIKWSDELFRIYDMEPQDRLIDPAEIRIFNRSAGPIKYVEEAIADGKPYEFIYEIETIKGNKKTLQAYGEMIYDENNKPVTIIGTAQDITEKYNLLETLEHSRDVYKEAEVLANMGNWSWNLATNKLEWTDQLYRIYGMEPQSEEITIDTFLSFIHPDDKPVIEKAIANAYDEAFLDYSFRIITRDGKTKILRSISRLKKDEKTGEFFVYGTERDITEKQTLIDRLKKSEELYKQAQALVNLGNWSYDLKTQQYTWSEEMFSIYEVAKGTLPPTDAVVDMMHPEDRDKVLDYLNECIQTGTPYDFIHRIILPSGKIKYLHRKGELVYENNQPVKLIGTTQDVTERELVQQELKENQTFIRKIADAAPSIIASYNINTGKYVFISEGLNKLLGYDPQEALEKGIEFFLDIIHPDDLASMASKNAQAIEAANKDVENDLIAEFTYRIKDIAGNYRWFHTFGTIFDRNEQGKVEHLLNISLDVTDQIETTRRLQEQEHFIQNLADASPTILYLYDVEKDAMIYMNREVFFVLGYDPDEILDAGSQVTERLYHPDDWHLLPERRASEKRFQQSTSMIQYECRMKYKDGAWRWFLVREVGFKTNEEGRVVQIVGAALDIQKRKEIESQLLQNSFQLKQSNASLEEFAYVASHDLKEPLRKISTFGDRLVETNGDQLNESGKLYLKKIIDASQRMQTMISDLLSISMISGNRSFERYSLQEVLNDTLQTLEFKIEQKNAIVKADALPETNMIPSQFRQLFQNLLSNSLKFVKEDEQPLIRITHQYLTPDEVAGYQLSKSTKYHKIEFIDNGIGFDNAYAGKIFTIFQRLHGRSEYEGTGIGLAICKKIVEHHGGVIFAAGKEGEGATFTIILPL